MKTAPIAVGMVAAVLSAGSLLAQGVLRGVVTGMDVRTARIHAIDRSSRATYPGVWEQQTGGFQVSGVPFDIPVDLVITDGTVAMEGIDLRTPPSDFEEEQPLRREDHEALCSKIKALSPFEDTFDFLAVTGNIQHAAVLVSKLKTGSFFGSRPGEVIWRMELWHFERPDETWVKVQSEMFVVLHRERLPRKEFDRKCLYYHPALGGLRVSRSKPVLTLERIVAPPYQPGIRLLSP